MPSTIQANIENIQKQILSGAQSDQKSSDLQKTVNTFLTPEIQLKVLLLLGDKTSTKTEFCNNLIINLWRDYKPDTPIPVLISLPKLKTPFGNAIEESLLGYGFTTEQISEIKIKHKFIFIIESYEQLKQVKSIYTTNRLGDWQAKIIVTCGSEYAAQFRDPYRYFMPFHGEQRQPQLLQVFAITPFSPNKTIAPVLFRDEKKPEEKTKPSQSDLNKDTKLTTPTLLPDNIIYQQLLTKDQGMIDNFADRVIESEIYKTLLFQLIELSKTDARYAIAAANAITALNRARVAFSGKDFRGIRIPGADVSYGIFDNTQMQDGDLREVNIQNAWLREADLSRTQMTAIQHNEMPSIRVDDWIKYICYSFDKHWLAVAVGKNINLYDVTTNTHVHTFKGHERDVINIAFSPSSKWLISSGGDDGAICLWEIISGKLIYTFKDQHIASVRCLVFQQDDKQFFVSKEDGTVWNYNTDNKVVTCIFESHIKIISMSYDIQTMRFITGSSNGTIRLWDLKTKTLLRIFVDKGHVDSVKCVAFHPQGIWIASGSQDDTVCLWDIENGELVHTFRGHGDGVNCIAFHANGIWLASGGSDNTICLWDLINHALIKTFDGHMRMIRSLTFAPQGEWLVSGGMDNIVYQWSLANFKSPPVFKSHAGKVTSIAVDPRGKWFASASWDKTIRCWDVRNGESLQQITDGHADVIENIAIDPQGKWLASASWDKTIKVWDIVNCKCMYTIAGYHTGFVASVAFHPQQAMLASGDYENNVFLWDLNLPTVKPLYNFKHKNSVMSIAFHPQGKWFASASYDKSVCLFDITDYKNILTFKHPKGVSSVVFHPREMWFAAGCLDNAIYLWNVNNDQQPLRIFKQHTDTVECLAFHLQGDWLASGGGDSVVYLWDVANGKLLNTLKGFGGVVHSVSWLQNSFGIFLATGSSDKTVRCWQIQQYKQTVQAILHWSSRQMMLVMSGAQITETSGLDIFTRALFKERGAVGEPMLADTKQIPSNQAKLLIQYHSVFVRPPVTPAQNIKKENNSHQSTQSLSASCNQL